MANKKLNRILKAVKEGKVTEKDLIFLENYEISHDIMNENKKLLTEILGELKKKVQNQKLKLKLKKSDFKGDKGEDGKNGKDGIDGKTGPQGKNGNDGSPDNPKEIRIKLESLKGSERLSAKYIKDLPEVDLDRILGMINVPRSSFTKLTDAPESYGGHAGKLVSVKSTEDGLEFITSVGSGTVTSVSVVSANGFAGTVANPTTTPAITLSTTVTGVLKGNGTAISAAVAGTDYENPLTFSAPLVRTVNTIFITQASGSANGYLSSTDWTTFNNKFTLPSLTTGSVLFSDGTTIAQDNANFFWDDTNNRLGILTSTFGTVAKLTINPYITVDNSAVTHITAAATGQKPLVLQAFSDSQTGAFFECQGSDGDSLFTITHSSAAAGINKAIVAIKYSNGSFINLDPGDNSVDTNIAMSTAGGITGTIGVNRSYGSFISGNGGGGFVFNSNIVRPGNVSGVFVDATISIGTSAVRFAPSYFTGLNLLNNTAGNVVLTVKGAASQSANLQEWQNSAGAVMSSISFDGTARFKKNTGTGSWPAIGVNVSWGSYFAAEGNGVAGIVIPNAYEISPSNSTGDAVDSTVNLGRTTHRWNIAYLTKAAISLTSAPTALLHLAAGTATANTAPLKFNSGTNLTTAEAGAMEYNGTDLFFTRAGTVRDTFLFKGATSQSTPADPNTTTSTTGVMMGLAGAITPVSTGRIMIVISGDMDNNTVVDGTQVQIRYGTGGAPANGDALTGTAAGGLVKKVNGAADTTREAVSVNAVVTGLTLATAVWVDISLAAITGGTARIRDLSVSIIEI